MLRRSGLALTIAAAVVGLAGCTGGPPSARTSLGDSSMRLLAPSAAPTPRPSPSTPPAPWTYAPLSISALLPSPPAASATALPDPAGTLPAGYRLVWSGRGAGTAPIPLGRAAGHVLSVRWNCRAPASASTPAFELRVAGTTLVGSGCSSGPPYSPFDATVPARDTRSGRWHVWAPPDVSWWVVVVCRHHVAAGAGRRGGAPGTHPG